MTLSAASLLSDSKLVKTKSYINGQWVGHEKQFPVVNPADQNVLILVADGDAAQTELAVEAAHDALASWRGLTANARADCLRKWFDLMMAHQDELAMIMTLEQGKPLAEAKGEVKYGASFVEWYAEEGKRIYGDTIPSLGSHQRILVMKQPIGVAAAITPWNFPNSMITRKAAPALAAGCTFVIRPAETTPLSALALAELADQAGIPAGVFNVVVGTDAQAMGEVLTQHPKVAKFSFTGSTGVGKKLMAQCATTVKKFTMELGGNAPFIVFDDADIGAAIEGAIASKYRNAGQTCVCANRFFVQESKVKEFTEKFAQAVASLPMGAGMEPGVEIGPLIHPEAQQQVKQLVEQSVSQGAKVVLGGQPHALGPAFYQPTILSDVTVAMPVAQKEIFGPVAPIIAFKDEADVIAKANDSEFGLAAYFYARDLGRVWRVAEALEYGIVGINEGIISNAAAPFGGVKQSGIGREGSKYGIEDYLETKYLCIGGITD